MGATAFSFSSSRMVWPLAMVSPSLTRMLTTTPPSAFSPSFGNLTSIKAKLCRGCSGPGALPCLPVCSTLPDGLERPDLQGLHFDRAARREQRESEIVFARIDHAGQTSDVVGVH